MDSGNTQKHTLHIKSIQINKILVQNTSGNKSMVMQRVIRDVLLPRKDYSSAGQFKNLKDVEK